MYDIKCGEIWGGIRGTNIEVTIGDVEACIFSSACDGDKGGDIYYFSVCTGDLLTRIAIADVMGHGRIVSDTSGWLYDLLRQKINCIEGYQVLSGLNPLVVKNGYKSLTTAAVISFYSETGELLYSYAGHHPALVRRKKDSEWVTLNLPETGKIANLPLGACNDVFYDQSVIPFGSDDLLFIYTDGLIEAPGPAGDLFGKEGLVETLNCVTGSPAEVKSEVLAALNRHVSGDFVHDDVTFMVIRIL